MKEIVTKQFNENLSKDTTRKKALEMMQKGIIVYQLNHLGWEISEHFGDGFDLIGVTTKKGKLTLAKIELKAVDLSSYAPNAKGFSQAISENEIFAATHLIVTIFKGIEPKNHYILSVKQAFNIKKKTQKFREFNDYKAFQEAVKYTAQLKIANRKGMQKKVSRLAMDIGCSFKKYNEGKWELQDFEGKWCNLLKANI